MSEVTKDDRVLLVVANLAMDGVQYEKLYEWLDQSAVNVANLLMRPHYRYVDTMLGNDVTSVKFLERVVNMAEAPHTKALDVFIVLHGSPGKLYFDDKAVTTSELADQLSAANLADRLRLLYSTACYGATHAPDFVRGGFCTASGAVAVCANGPYELPVQLTKWGAGNTYKSAVKAGNDPVFLAIHDHTAHRLLGFDDVNSEKVIFGKKLTRITSKAQ